MHSQTDSREVARERVHIVAAQPEHAADQAEVFYQAVMQGRSSASLRGAGGGA
ncbi:MULTISPECIES: hypothetical protein [unclassified Cobetia]|uniref:hypothetical protein n=1 Tax=unclassified Cobetia TaxID=2609414 RepID=UPI0020976E31|nr:MULTISPECIES: hypothetical protein [unclassified Cobetia]MCO7233650.1 hypothetical protein [Cobetia sp. Dlab-2-AX]MCO7236878.1 hypothetical protein [Cobetia sp. Dlab-2-U]